MKRIFTYLSVLLIIATIGVVFPVIFKTDAVYSHIFYIAIALTTIWYPRFSIPVGFLFGMEHLIVEFILNNTLELTIILRAIAIVFVSAMLSKIWGKQQKYIKQIQMLSFENQHDSQTKLYNRNYFYSLFQEEHCMPVAIFVCDIDNLKATNDRYGHAVGDVLIVEMGEFLLSSIKYESVLARLGGDEFAVMIQNLDLAAAEALLSEIKTALIKYNLDKDEHLKISFSIGFSICEDKNHFYETMKQADRAMYLEKIIKKTTLNSASI